MSLAASAPKSVCLPSTARSISRRLRSYPSMTRLGLLAREGETRHWTSRMVAREPAPAPAFIIAAVSAEPGPAFLPRRMCSEGLSTETRPSLPILKTPTSLVAPYRFFSAERTRMSVERSASKLSTVSTKCSSVLGPAMSPSLLTWPMMMVVMPLAFEMPVMNPVDSWTWSTLPGRTSSMPGARIV